MVTMGAGGRPIRRQAGPGEGGARLVAVGFFGVDAGRVLLQRPGAPFQRLLRGLPATGPEHVPLPDPVQPPLQLLQVDLVLSSSAKV